MATKNPITIAAVGPKHTATVIVAHGLGDTGLGWVFLAEQWIQEKKFDYVKFIFPNAPTIPISVNGGATMPDKSYYLLVVSLVLTFSFTVVRYHITE
jgi:predicted esterase